MNSCTKRTTDAAVYREAARRLEAGETVSSCSCIAIQHVLGKLHDDRFSRVALRYIKMFKPDGADASDLWGLGWGDDPYVNRTDIQNCRILALCFMAAMAAAGDA